MADGLVVGADGLPRCAWAASTDDYTAYHDLEWGRAVHGDVALFERLSLEAFQSGLSWLTILRRREGLRTAFAGFVPEVVAAFDDRDVARLMADAGIVRNRAKIEATIGNARALLDLDEPLCDLVWRHAPTGVRPAPSTLADVPATTPASVALSRELKRRGFRFVGPTTVYAFMQAMGLVNDHLTDCFVRETV